jgi:hypothetical protein
MEYLNCERLQSLSAGNFQNRKPFPWVQIDNLLTPEGYALLHRTLPPFGQFEHRVGIPRGRGLAPHDRYLLHFHPGMKVEQPWVDLIGELQGPTYEAFLRRMFGEHRFLPTFEWHYARDGCGIAPHCDAARRLATQIFYFNTEEDWRPDWGGQILILDSGWHFNPITGPRFEQFGIAASVEPLGNGSLLLQRTRHAWHGMRPLDCPPNKLHRLFVVTVNVPCLQVWWRGMRGLDPDGHSLKAA